MQGCLMAKVIRKKNSTLKTQPKKYARKKGLRKGTASYNAYVYGTASRRFSQKYRKRRGH